MPVVATVMGMPRRPVGKTPRFGNRVKIRRHLAQHAGRDRTPDGEQYSQKDEEPDAKDFHFFMLPQGRFSSDLRGGPLHKPGDVEIIKLPTVGRSNEDSKIPYFRVVILDGRLTFPPWEGGQ